MKILLPLFVALLFPALASAQTDQQLCRQCCYVKNDEDLARVIAPILARQCFGCQLISAGQCTTLEKEFNGGESVLIHYKLTLPGGSVAVHCAEMERNEWTEWEWSVRLYPPDYGLKPDCAATR